MKQRDGLLEFHSVRVTTASFLAVMRAKIAGAFRLIERQFFGHRKGGADKLKALIPPKYDPAALAALSDDRVLAEMAERVFTSFSSHGAV